MTAGLAVALSGLTAAIVCSIAYYNSDSPFIWPHARFPACFRCVIDGGVGVAAYFIAEKWLKVHGQSWWWATGLAAPAILRSYVTTWQSASGDKKVNIGPGLLYDKMTAQIEEMIARGQGRDISKWLGTQVEPALRDLTTDDVIARFDPVLRHHSSSQDELARTIAQLKKISRKAANGTDSPARIAFYYQIITLGGRDVLKDLVSEAPDRNRQTSQANLRS